jgi:uncharacterized membrane protein
MSLQPLLDASPIIQLHAYAAVLAFFLGGVVLFRRKGDTPHKKLGLTWVGLMVTVCLTSFFIWELRVFGLFSPIHLLSVLTLYALWQAVRYARQRKIKAHMRMMQLLYLAALVITGWFTFMPGRTMNRVVFGQGGAGPVESAIFLGATIAVGGFAVWLVRRAGNGTLPFGFPRLGRQAR